MERCCACNNSYYEGTGHRHTATMVLCGPCALHFVKWVERHTKAKWGGFRFYDYTETSRNKT